MVDHSSATTTPGTTPRRIPLTLLVPLLLLALGAVGGIGLRWGSVDIPTSEWIKFITPSARQTPWGTILYEVRLPRVLLAMVAGSGLAAAGATWQGLLRNPLADPYLIGVSAGGALGAGVAILFGPAWGLDPGWVPMGAFAGSLLAVGLVYALAGHNHAIERVLLVGIAIGSFLTALLSLACYWHPEAIATLTIWMMGSFSGRSWPDLLHTLPYWGVGLALIASQLRSLNVLQLGPERARTLGVEVARSELVLVAGASLVTAAVVSACGMIGFVGLIMPHLARMLVGHDLRRVAPVGALLGAILLVASDLVARTAWAPSEVPVGVLTAMLGAPFFLALVVGRRSA